jgi:hypothetical protein
MFSQNFEDGRGGLALNSISGDSIIRGIHQVSLLFFKDFYVQSRICNASAMSSGVPVGATIANFAQKIAFPRSFMLVLFTAWTHSSVG